MTFERVQPLPSRRRKASLPRVAHLRSAWSARLGDVALTQPLPGYGRLRRLGGAGVFSLLLAFDPTPKAVYLQAVIRWFVSCTVRVEDGRRVRDTLARFHACKRFLPEGARDINAYKSPGHVAEALSALEGGGLRVPLRMPDTVAQASPAVASGDDWSIRSLDSFEAARWWADSTGWCTRHRRHFESYRRLGALYVMERAGRKFQVSDPADQAMDETDTDGMDEIRALFPPEALAALARTLLDDRLAGIGSAVTSGLGLPRAVSGRVTGQDACMLPVLSRNVVARLFGLEMHGDANYMVCAESRLLATASLRKTRDAVDITFYRDGHAKGRSRTYAVEAGDTSGQPPRVRQVMALLFRSAGGQLAHSDAARLHVPAIGRRGHPLIVHEVREFRHRVAEILKRPGGSPRQWAVTRGDTPLALVSLSMSSANAGGASVLVRLFGQGKAAGTVRDSLWSAGDGGTAMDAMGETEARVLRALFRHVYPGHSFVAEIGPELLSPAAARHWFGPGDVFNADQAAGLVTTLRSREGKPGRAVPKRVVDGVIDLVAPDSDLALRVAAHPLCLALSPRSTLRKRLLDRCMPGARRLLEAVACTDRVLHRRAGAPAADDVDLLSVAHVSGTGHLVAGVDPALVGGDLVDAMLEIGRAGVVYGVPRELLTEERVALAKQHPEFFYGKLGLPKDWIMARTKPAVHAIPLSRLGLHPAPPA